MEQRGLRSRGGPGVEDCRQHFIVDIDTPGRSGIHAPEARVGMGTAQHLAPQHAGDIHVGGKARASGDFVQPLHLGDRGPDKRCVHVHLTIPLV
jgi:hypothetical protein